MLTQQEVDSIHKAFRDALTSYNSNAREKVVDSKATFSACAQYLRSEQVDQRSWDHKNIWSAAILAVHGQLEKVPVKSREEKEQELRAADAKPGRQRYRKDDGHKTTDGFADLAERAQKNLQKLFDTTPSEAQSQPKTDWPTLQVDFEQMEPADRKKFLKLTVDETKQWMKLRTVIKHRQLHNLDPQE